MAKLKANDVSAKLEQPKNTLILGCDSIFEIDGQALGKPHTPKIALERILEMSGKSGVLHTGYALNLEGRQVSSVCSTVVNFEHFSEQEAKAYVQTGEPLEVAGSFTIDGRGAALISSIEGDYHNVVGISPNQLRHLMRQLDLEYVELW
ncbi:hypothetical protein FACS1894125_0100 [Actinomycetota bacterium]|nr:hypothetical protein FACS1894125_0100 [Actinomycetota bacterium]